MSTRVITISGSDRPESSNTLLLHNLHSLGIVDVQFSMVDIGELPLFTVALDRQPLPKTVINFRQEVKSADAVIFSTPEYIHNIPARLKNALEWLTTSGELVGKPVLALTYTPSAPRGERAMQSLLWSLQALDATIVTQLPLYQTELLIDEDLNMQGEESVLMLEAALALLH